MRVNYFFPIFEGDNSKKFLEKFIKSKNYKMYEKDSKIIFACNRNDKINFNYLSDITLKDKEKYQIIFFDTNFSYNDAFKSALKYFDGDINLFGDTKILKVDLIFDKCIEKKKENINIVHVVKKKTKVKGFLSNIFNNIYNFFVKIFTGKHDRLNIISLGLVDGNVMDLLKTLPNKCCFLKNTKELRGFGSRTIYIDDSMETYNSDFYKKTSSLITTMIISIFFIILLFVTIILNVFIRTNLNVYNIVSILLMLLCLIIIMLLIPKHIFDIRNREDINKK